MILFPDLIECRLNNFILKKVSQVDLHHIWDTAPHHELFLVTGCEAGNESDFFDIMQTDWTTWYLMLNDKGNSFGLIRIVPEIDDVLSLHGIGWLQPGCSPRTYVMSWYGIHYWLFTNNHEIIKTYCDYKNTGAIQFDFKTGYTYDYWMPSVSNKSKLVHLKIEKDHFLNILEKKNIRFDLGNVQFSAFELPLLLKAKAISKKKKMGDVEIFLVNEREILDSFFQKHRYDAFFYFFQLIPRPNLYQIFMSGKLIGEFLLNEIKGQQTLVLFISVTMTFPDALDFLNALNGKIKLNPNDILFIKEFVPCENLKNAISIWFQYSGNHSEFGTQVWIV